MKNLINYIFTFLIILGAGANVSGSEGHGTSPASSDFQIGNTHVSFSLDPLTYTEGKIPRVSVMLTDAMSGSPVLDAELYVYVQESAQLAAHAGHAMPSPDTSGSEDGSSGLDFGDSAQMSSSYDLSAFARLLPDQKAGVYTTVYHLHKKGEYTFILALKTLAGKKYAEPLIYGGKITYAKASKAPFYRMIFVIGLIILSGISGVWVLSLRRSANIQTGHKLNILDIPGVKRFFRSAWFQPVFQIPVLLFFLIIIIAGLFDIQQGDRNIATLLMWTIWWAAIIFTFVFVGRVWCMICPFGAAQDWINRLFSLNRDFPKPVRNIWLSSFIFFGLTWWDSYSGIVNKPALTAYLLIGFFAVAVSMAAVFKGRSFCRYVCPIGGLIGLYSMFSPVELRNKCMEVCREHKMKECIKGTEHSRGCPMFVTPMTLDRNNYCNFCSECVKSCSQDNIIIRFRSFAKDLWISAKGYMDEAYLAMVLVGMTIIVTGEMVEPWHVWMDAVGKVIPLGKLGLLSHAESEKMTFLIVMTAGSLIIPLLLLVVASLIVRRATGPESPLGFGQTLVRFSYMFIPVGLSMHLAHNISHLFKEGPGIIPAFQRVISEYAGLGTGEVDWNITPLMGNEAIFWLQMLVLVVLNLFSLYAGYRIAVRHYGDRALRAFIPMAVLALSFMVINAFILGQPMALRHTH